MNPEQEGDEGRGTLLSDGAARREPGRSAATVGLSAARQERQLPSAISTTCSWSATRKPTSSTARSFRVRSTPTRPTSCARPWPACSGASSSTTTTWTSGSKNAAPIRSRRRATGAAQRPLAPHVQRRHHLHARQVGVSLVCGLGPGLSCRRLDAGGPGFRQAAAEADAARALHAPQRPDSGLRVELRRRQSAGACLVHHFHLSTGKGEDVAKATRSGSRRSFPEAAPELHLVGQPQGPLGAERLRGGLPGPGQHRRLRSQRAAADRRAIWSRPTARPGWPCSARTCSRSPASWP